MTKKYVCIHGHFYQPPRENPWLETVETQESAYPDHDWNQRITRECYAMNARARVQNAAGKIVRLSNNYAHISFNFGPTLLAWMQEQAQADYARIIDADRASMVRFDGHGSAMAQAYNHSILPLCNPRDIITQVRWGVRDFEDRYNRKPEGMWLPEAAVDTPSLEALAAEGIKFTVLAPRQCGQIRDLTGREFKGEWHDPHGGVDPTRAYWCNLPSGKKIAIFFYDGPISQAVAFEGLLNDGARFASRLTTAFNDNRAHDQLVHIATDGESYGHHHKHGEMALASALEHIEHTPGIELINYALYLERHPPTLECRIIERSSWSCAHGVERWRADCGCNTGRQGWHQRWRAPLRKALDWLRDEVNARYERFGDEVFTDLWAARDAYIDVILARAHGERKMDQAIDAFLDAYASRASDNHARSRALCMMELQRHAMLMYTSCAWFFDDVAGIESSQVLQYAGRVIQLAKTLYNVDLEPEFCELLAEAIGNDAALPDAEAVYTARVRTSMLDEYGVGAHYALSRVFDGRADRIYTYDAHTAATRRRSAGRARLLVGHGRLTSRITREEWHMAYAVLHQGDHSASCGVRQFHGEELFDTAAASLEEAFDRADYTEVLRQIEREFHERGVENKRAPFTVASLFRDEQHAVVRRILEPTLRQIDAAYTQIYEQHAPLARFLRSLSLTVPRRIQFVGVFVLSHGIRHALLETPSDIGRAIELVDEAAREGVTLDQHVVDHAAALAMSNLANLPPIDGVDPLEQPRILQQMVDLATFTKRLPFHVDIWPLQAAMVERVLPLAEVVVRRASKRDAEAQEWMRMLPELGEILRVQV